MHIVMPNGFTLNSACIRCMGTFENLTATFRCHKTCHKNLILNV